MISLKFYELEFFNLFKDLDFILGLNFPKFPFQQLLSATKFNILMQICITSPDWLKSYLLKSYYAS